VFILGDKTPVVEVVTVREDRGGRSALLNASGYITPRQRATIAAKITGRVNAIFAEEGVHVQPGQVLATLDDVDARARLASVGADRDATAAALGDLRVNLANAERELWRIEALRARELVSQQDRDQARMAVDSLRARIKLASAQVSAAEARIRVAQQDLDNCTVRAPFAGVVVSKDAQVGEMVSPVSAGGSFTRTGIATIVDMDSLEIEVDVNESYIARVKPGQPVTAVLDAYADWQIPAKVRTVIPTADRQKATVKVRVAFDRLDPRILPDMGVKVTFFGDETSHPRMAALGFESAGGPARAGRQSSGVRVPRRASGSARGPLGSGARRRARGDRGLVRWGAGGDDGARELRDGQRAQLKR